MSAQPGADELRIRSILKTRGIGPGAAAPAPSEQLPPAPPQRPRDWLDDILASPAAPAPALPVPQPEPPATQPEHGAAAKTPRKGSRRAKAQAAPLGWERSPRQSLIEAYDRIPPRVRWLAYHASAAYLGWTVGLVDWTTYVTAWIADTGLIGPQAVFWYCAAGGTFLLHHRSRGWWWPVAWLAAVPASSVVTGVLLYAPTT